MLVIKDLINEKEASYKDLGMERASCRINAFPMKRCHFVLNKGGESLEIKLLLINKIALGQDGFP